MKKARDSFPKIIVRHNNICKCWYDDNGMKNAISINPLNWKRDETYAPVSKNKGDRLPVVKENEFLPSEFEPQRPGHADAKLDVERGVVVCTTLPERYVTPIEPGPGNLFGPASLHLIDYTAYWDNLRENVQTRTKAYLSHII